MCDFFSCIVTKDGRLLHEAHNSHSKMVEEFNQRENQPNREPFFLETEWNAEDSLDVSSIFRGGSPNEKQIKQAKLYYESLRDLLADPVQNEGMLLGSGIFADDRFADVRWRVINLPNLDHRLADRLSKMRLYADAQKSITSLHPSIVTLEGNLSVSSSAKLDAPALTEVGGNLSFYGSAKLDALTKVGGNLSVYGSAKLDALTKVGGDLTVSSSAKLDAPALTEVGGNLSVYDSAKLDAPALTEVGSNLSVYGSAKLDALTKVGGNLSVYGIAKLDALTKVGGNLSVYGIAKLDALTKVGGNLSVYDSAKLGAPALTEVGGNLTVWPGGEWIAPKLNDGDHLRVFALSHR